MLANKLKGAGKSAVPAYIEDVFSTYLYNGTGTDQTITNGIDLSGKGGLVWIKDRSAANRNALTDTARGKNFWLSTENTLAQINTSNTYGIGQFNANGFDLTGVSSDFNASGSIYASWTFRKQAKFFDVVTYTGDGVAGRQIAHSLGVAPGMIVVKQTSGTGSNWFVYHRSNGNNGVMYLNATDPFTGPASFWNQQDPTASVFYIGGGSTNVNGESFVAYLFAHDAGGFGASGTDNVISCGSYTGNGSATGPTVTLGWEPQWLLVKNATSGTFGWIMLDSMRGFSLDSDAYLEANSSNNEGTLQLINPTATGFNVVSTAGAVNTNASTYIYIAIRRGPMKTPTSGTSVYNAITWTGNTSTSSDQRNLSGAGFPPDLFMIKPRNSIYGPGWFDKLRGAGAYLQSFNTYNESAADTSNGVYTLDYPSNYAFGMDGFNLGDWKSNYTGRTYVGHFFRRAFGFFDVVCYTGTGSATTVTHNLGVAPELMIVKNRSDATGRAWAVYANNDNTDYLVLNTTAATADDIAYWNDTSPTASVFTVGTSNSTNESGDTFVAYLFATCPGVSKVGSYTGNGSSQTINCGFTNGARFVLIKRTDSTGDWYVFDSARGIVAGSDPFIKTNTTTAEDATRDALDPDNSGFIVNEDATNFPINTNNATYIYLAIA